MVQECNNTRMHPPAAPCEANTPPPLPSPIRAGQAKSRDSMSERLRGSAGGGGTKRGWRRAGRAGAATAAASSPSLLLSSSDPSPSDCSSSAATCLRPRLRGGGSSSEPSDSSSSSGGGARRRRPAAGALPRRCGTASCSSTLDSLGASRSCGWVERLRERHGSVPERWGRAGAAAPPPAARWQRCRSAGARGTGAAVAWTSRSGLLRKCGVAPPPPPALSAAAGRSGAHLRAWVMCKTETFNRDGYIAYGRCRCRDRRDW